MIINDNQEVLLDMMSHVETQSCCIFATLWP